MSELIGKIKKLCVDFNCSGLTSDNWVKAISIPGHQGGGIIKDNYPRWF